MPNTKVDHTTPAIVSAGASPVTLVIQPHAFPLNLVITSASAITVTGTAVESRPVSVDHTP